MVRTTRDLAPSDRPRKTHKSAPTGMIGLVLVLLVLAGALFLFSRTTPKPAPAAPTVEATDPFAGLPPEPPPAARSKQ